MVLESLEPGLSVQIDIVLVVATHSPAARLDLHGGKDGRVFLSWDKTGQLCLYSRDNSVEM